MNTGIKQNFLGKLPDDAPRVAVQPSLNRDLAGFLTALFIIITYHIQHPTLLSRSLFGRSFRDEGFQEGIALAMVVAALFLLGSWRLLLDGRFTWIGRAKLVLVAGLVLYGIQAFVNSYFHTNLIFEWLNVSPEILEDVFRERELVPLMQTLNVSAVLGGMTLASAICLWSPWERIATPQAFQLNEFGYDIIGLGMVALIWITYYIQNPMLLARTNFGANFENTSYQFSAALFLVILGLMLFAPHLQNPHPIKSAMMFIISLYILHVLSVVLAGDHFLMNFYNVTPENFDLLPDDPQVNRAILGLDRAALLAGIGMAGALYLWSPWENLATYNKVFQKNIVPIGIAFMAVVIWEALIEIYDIKQFLLPRPSVIWLTLTEEYDGMIAAGWNTFLNAFKGFMVGCGLGILTGLISARFIRFSTAVLPLAIAANSIPIIAFAPIMNIWFGVTSPNSKVAIVAIMTYFPAMISTVRGLTSVNKTQLELMRSYAATEMDIFRKLRIPNALPFIFSALKLATTLSMIGAIVSEFFGGSLAGLGYRIREDAALFRFPESWSAIIVASLFGIAFYLTISSLERAAMPWYRSFRQET